MFLTTKRRGKRCDLYVGIYYVYMVNWFQYLWRVQMNHVPSRKTKFFSTAKNVNQGEKLLFFFARICVPCWERLKLSGMSAKIDINVARLEKKLTFCSVLSSPIHTRMHLLIEKFSFIKKLVSQENFCLSCNYSLKNLFNKL